MTQMKVSTGLIESLLHLSSVQARIVGVTHFDINGYILFEIEGYGDEPLPEGVVTMQVTQSIDTKVVPA